MLQKHVHSKLLVFFPSSSWWACEVSLDRCRSACVFHIMSAAVIECPLTPWPCPITMSCGSLNMCDGSIACWIFCNSLLRTGLAGLLLLDIAVLRHIVATWQWLVIDLTCVTVCMLVCACSLLIEAHYQVFACTCSALLCGELAGLLLLDIAVSGAIVEVGIDW